jgi:asparagine synthetase B (glutamine-hydrolysing)
MAAALQHRGPDDAGCWTDASLGVALAHRRLAFWIAAIPGTSQWRAPIAVT